MKHFRPGWFCIVAGLAIASPRMLEAAPVRFALLTDARALADTLRFLQAAGCERRALASFESLASNRTARLSLDLSHFPHDKAGFYEFASVQVLADALPTNVLCGGIFDFNCFDAALLLAGARLQTALKPDDLTGPFLVWRCATNRGPTASWIMPAATARDAFAANYGPYMEVSTVKFPQDLQDSRICLTATLFGVNILPTSFLTNDSSNEVFEVLQARWRRDGLKFPKDFEFLLLHHAQGLILRTSHAGLIFPRGREFTYIEKTCGDGNFIRLDVSNKKDVFEWVWGMHTDTNTDVKVFVTLNEKITELFAAPEMSTTNSNRKRVKP